MKQEQHQSSNNFGTHRKNTKYANKNSESGNNKNTVRSYIIVQLVKIDRL